MIEKRKQKGKVFCFVFYMLGRFLTVNSNTAPTMAIAAIQVKK